MTEYAVYRGDEFIIVGTLEECAERLNTSEQMIKYYSYPSQKKRSEGTNKILVERLDDDA
ncbi:hypothetical protein HMI01_11250 [Halolactibacillus miurensis]|uniref:Uncharacterized protein n=1 Tax=Halolactibacillus miurensis TaxID=306541 RepID=A0A1I6SG22_9BACI|nr:hypothetical protein [Halolactibacillus miurensis]GEM04137.1 hypothetical protein HMI01_11250 [Halolactibacillus miurensis]SFS75859.1 hypothetical protein SAMN05421668_10918 [Halolactibacillus miurensis]